MDTLLAAHRARGMTQGNVARATGISVPTLRALERGEGGLGPLVAVMKVLGLRWGWVPHGEDAAAALAGRRKALGISQAELSRRIGCSRPTLIALERRLAGSVATWRGRCRSWGCGRCCAAWHRSGAAWCRHATRRLGTW